jgi:hypothetical protein
MANEILQKNGQKLEDSFGCRDEIFLLQKRKISKKNIA